MFVIWTIYLYLYAISSLLVTMVTFCIRRSVNALDVNPGDVDLSQGGLHEQDMDLAGQNEANQNTNGDTSPSATITLRMIMQGKVCVLLTVPNIHY